MDMTKNTPEEKGPRDRLIQGATILLVDDEEVVLSSIKAFFALEGDYNLLTYTSPVKALESLDQDHENIDLVISDYLMPEMDGITFLAKVKERLPLVPRILLTGYGDKQNAIKAINNVGLYQYIEKPWDNNDLKLVIRNGLEKTILLKQLEEKIKEVDRAHRELSDVHKDILRVFA
jgi:cyclic di-GMP phosphodiesterase